MKHSIPECFSVIINFSCYKGGLGIFKKIIWLILLLSFINPVSLAPDGAEQIPILCYHHLYDADLGQGVFKEHYTVLPLDLFKEHMQYLSDNDFYTATLDELADYLEGKIKLPIKTVVLTFDDGYSSVKDLAYPVLKSFDFQAAVFIIGKFSEDASNGLHRSKDFQYLTYENIEEILDVFTIGNHTFDLHRLNSEQMPLLLAGSPPEIKKDFLKMQELFNTKFLAYPYGAYSAETVKILEDTGHKLAFTVNEGYLSSSTDRYEIPRFGIFSYTSLAKFKKIVDFKR